MPLRILIGALGGEGGGVLASWLVHAAQCCGFPAQTTSIPGVAQRTGSTTYYVEILPIPRTMLAGREPVLALSPTPGAVDLMVASELVEASRAAQAGFVTPDCTTLIASLDRAYTVAEKSAMAEGRIDSAALVSALRGVSSRAVLFDMGAAARRTGTVVSAVMFGAIAASGGLAIPRETFEQTIRTTAKDVDASLRGFAAGFEAVQNRTSADPSPERVIAKRADQAVPAAIGQLPSSLRLVVEQGWRRVRDYQDARYAQLYLDRVQAVVDAQRTGGQAGDQAVSIAYARFLALWMSYEDVIRVADLKSRRSRLERIRRDSGLRDADVMTVTEFMRPGIDEWSSIVPPRFARRLRAWAQHRSPAHPASLDVRVKTTTIRGFLMLRALASLRWWRPRTSRYAEEQRLIDRWTRAVLDALPHSPSLAAEIAWCGRLIKGYGDTNARGKASFQRILDTIVAASSFPSDDARAQAVRAAREAALADPAGRKLDQSLAQHGFPMRPVQPQPIVLHRRSIDSQNLRAGTR